MDPPSCSPLSVLSHQVTLLGLVWDVIYCWSHSPLPCKLCVVSPLLTCSLNTSFDFSVMRIEWDSKWLLLNYLFLVFVFVFVFFKYGTCMLLFTTCFCPEIKEKMALFSLGGKILCVSAWSCLGQKVYGRSLAATGVDPEKSQLLKSQPVRRYAQGC